MVRILENYSSKRFLSSLSLFVVIVVLDCICGRALSAFDVTQEEADCYRSFGRVSTRASEEAVEIIRKNRPDSFVCDIVTGRIALERGRYPNALRLFLRARAAIESRSDFKSNAGSIPWHAITVNSIISCLDSMGRPEDALAAIEDYLANGYEKLEQLNPDLKSVYDIKIWCLIKSGRKAEALKIAERKMNSRGLSPEEMIEVKTIYANAMFANHPDGRKAFELYTELIRDGKLLGLDDRLPYANASFHFRKNGMYSDSVDMLLESSKYPSADSESFPWRHLAEIHASTCDWEKTFNAYKQGWNWLLTKRNYIRQELDKDLRLSLSQFYLAIGRPDRSLQTIKPLLKNQVRAGFSSGSVEYWMAGAVLTALSAERQTEVIRRDVSSLGGWTDRIKGAWRQCIYGYEVDALRMQLCSLLVSQKKSGDSPRDFLSFANCPVWLWPEIFIQLSPRVGDRLMKDHPVQGLQGVFVIPAFEAERMFSSKMSDNIIDAVDRGLADIPKEEELLRSRLIAIRGDSLSKQSPSPEVLDNMIQAYKTNPAVFRMLAIKLPLAVISDNSRDASSINRLLSMSSEITFSDNGIKTILKSTGNGCVSVSLYENDDDKLRDFDILLFDSGVHRPESAIFIDLVNGILTSSIYRQSDLDALEGKATDFIITKRGKIP